MARDEREEQQETKKHRFLFEGFGSEEEFRAALANLEAWLTMLRSWGNGPKPWDGDVPDRTRN